MNHDVILAIVIIELVIAFSVGFMCIIFSFNLLRALKLNPEGNTTMTTGEFPPSRPSQIRMPSFSLLPNADDYTAIQDNNPRRVLSHGSEMDFETQMEPPDAVNNKTIGLFQTFTSYIRLW